MPEETPTTTPANTRSRSEVGNVKFAETLRKYLDTLLTFDQNRLKNLPDDVKIAVLESAYTNSVALNTKINDSKSAWRTLAKDKSDYIDTLAPTLVRSISLLEAQGVSKDRVKLTRSFMNKMQGKSKKSASDPDAPQNTISNSQRSDAQTISFYLEGVDFLDAQAEYAGVLEPDFTVAALRARGETAQAKNEATIAAYAALSADRRKRMADFYQSELSIYNLVVRVKNFVEGVFGRGSAEDKALKQIKFTKPSNSF